MDRPFFSFNPHGLNGRDLPGTIEEMAEESLKILRKMCPAGPFWLGGFCNGAFVAHEMARILSREGRKLHTSLLLIEITPVAYIDEAFQRPKPAAPVGSQTHKKWLLNEIFRMSGSYKPQKYDGKVVVIQSEENSVDESMIQSTWNSVAGNLEFYRMPGDHISCMGRHVADLVVILNT